MLLRAVTEDDRDDILLWRNDPVTRAMSRIHDPVATINHQTWFARMLIDPGQLMVMAIEDDRKIGVVRFSQDKNCWEVGINLNPVERGHGMGHTVLAQAIDYFWKFYPKSPLRAIIRPDNKASHKIFTSCGFEWIDRSLDHDHLEAYNPGERRD
jgi:RimJ/RimL family protein N-acetyltransferase